MSSILFKGLQVLTNEYLTKTMRVETDTSPFIEYEPKDDWWRIKYGWVTFKTIPDPTIYRVENILSMHPATWAKLQNEMEKLEGPSLKVPKLPGGLFFP